MSSLNVLTASSPKPTSLKQRLKKVTQLVIAVALFTMIGDIVSFRILQNAKNNYFHAVDWIIRLDDIGVKIKDLTISIQNLDNPVLIGKKSQFEKTTQIIKSIHGAIEELISVAPNEDFLPGLQGSIAILERQLTPAVSKWHDELIPSSTATHTSETLFYHDYVPMRDSLDELIMAAKAKAQQASRLYADHQSLLMRIAALGLAVFLAFATGFAVYLSRRLSKTIVEILSNLSDQLSKSIRDVQKVSHNIDSASRQVASSATEHASAIEETAASMEEMTAMVTQSNNNAANSLMLSRKAEQEGEKGKEIVSQLNSAMQQIQESTTKLGTILKIIEDIRSKTTIINDIVFETRLLSFNASIEAARAGIHGKGFAVVAEEVGKLASLSGKAAGEIRNLLDSSVAEVNQIIGVTQEKIISGKSVSEQAGQAFFSMAEALRQIADAMESITTASSQQEQGIRETNRAMMDIAHVTQKNSSSAEKMLSQTSSLGQLVQNYTDTIMSLRLFISGDLSEAVKKTGTSQSKNPIAPLVAEPMEFEEPRPSPLKPSPGSATGSSSSEESVSQTQNPPPPSNPFGMEPIGKSGGAHSHSEKEIEEIEKLELPQESKTEVNSHETSGSLSADDLARLGGDPTSSPSEKPVNNSSSSRSISRNDTRWVKNKKNDKIAS